jgi:signal transduction histidine kinase
MTLRTGLGILVVEDDADTRGNLRDILELDDHQVFQAGSAAEAMRIENWRSIHLIILDRKLPDGSAEEVLPRLKQVAPHAAVIVVTGYGDLDSTIAAMRLGAYDYILKPINPEALRASIVRFAELREAQQRALHAERLAAIGQMIAGLAHESRNALQRSQACLEMLKMEVEDRPAALNLASRIQRAQDDLTRLYEEVRSYAAPITLDCTDMDLASVWRQAWSEMEEVRQSTQVTLQEQGNLPARCWLDPFAMGQVFRNILENALFACLSVESPDGPLSIRISCEPTTYQGRAAWQVRIHDDGTGISDKLRDRVFEPFFTTKTKGTGLGMAIARRIVEAHGGELELAPPPDRGTEFVLTLPRACDA